MSVHRPSDFIAAPFISLAGDVFSLAANGNRAALRERLIDFSLSLHAFGHPTVGDLAPVVEAYLAPVAAVAFRGLTAFIDSQPQAHIPAFHNVRHYLDVVAASLAFALSESANPSLLGDRRTPLSSEDISDCAVAALIHDLLQPGGNNGEEAFKFEEQSWQLAKPFLQQAGYAEARLERLHVLLLATDPKFGRPVTRLALAYHDTHDAAERAQINALMLQNPPTVARARGLTDALITCSLRDRKQSILSAILNKGDVFFSEMPETYLERTRDLHDEYAPLGLFALVYGADRLPVAGCGVYFLTAIAHADEKNRLQSLNEIAGDGPARTLALVKSDGFSPQRPSGPGMLPAPTLQS